MSGFYDAALQDFTAGAINLSSDVIKMRLTRTSSYTFSPSDTSMTPVLGGIGTDPTLGSIVLSGGTFDAANVVYSAVPTGAAINALVIYKFVTNDAGSIPIAYIDGFSVTPNGGNITVQWASSSPFIFKV